MFKQNDKTYSLKNFSEKNILSFHRNAPPPFYYSLNNAVRTNHFKPYLVAYSSQYSIQVQNGITTCQIQVYRILHEELKLKKYNWVLLDRIQKIQQKRFEVQMFYAEKENLQH